MDFNPPEEDVQEVELFIGATTGEQNPGTIYTDQTGHFPVRSFHGKMCQFVEYDYRGNAILVCALTDQTDKSMLEAFQDVYEYLTKRGFQPKLNVMDNQCSKTIQTFIKKNGAKIQLVNPDDHRVNAAERAIQTWKNHWLSGLGTLDPNCPLQLWCQFIEQGQDTLNMRIISRINNRLSAYAILDGQFEFDKTPLFSWIQKKNIMEYTCSGCMVCRALQKSLPKLQVLHPRKERIQNSKHSKILSTTLQATRN